MYAVPKIRVSHQPGQAAWFVAGHCRPTSISQCRTRLVQCQIYAAL